MDQRKRLGYRTNVEVLESAHADLDKKFNLYRDRLRDLQVGEMVF